MDPKVIELDVGLGGKPKLSSTHDAAFRFNVSHSGDLALIAITNGCEVGVDVEQVRDVNHMEQIAKRFFLPSEYGAIMELSPADQCHAFLRCWTGKEAVLKAIGEGIATNWSVAGLTDNDRATWIDVPARNSGGPLGCWQQPLALGSDYVGAIAFCNYKRVVRCFALTI
jgi:4'-phosphopantetheinyl transferase